MSNEIIITTDPKYDIDIPVSSQKHFIDFSLNNPITTSKFLEFLPTFQSKIQSGMKAQGHPITYPQLVITGQKEILDYKDGNEFVKDFYITDFRLTFYPKGFPLAIFIVVILGIFLVLYGVSIVFNQMGKFTAETGKAFPDINMLIIGIVIIVLILSLGKIKKFVKG